jgi:hypothetical protein
VTQWLRPSDLEDAWNKNIPQTLVLRDVDLVTCKVFLAHYFLIIVNSILNFVSAFNPCGSLAGMMMASPVDR